MKLEFLKEKYPQCGVIIETENRCERASIKNADGDFISVYYDPDDRDREQYMFMYSYQHRHIETEEELIGILNSFISGKLAAIEFFFGEKRVFGGDIETALLDTVTYDGIREYFGCFDRDMSHFDFKVRCWNKKYSFDGHFEKNEQGEVTVIKDYDIDGE